MTAAKRSSLRRAKSAASRARVPAAEAGHDPGVLKVWAAAPRRTRAGEKRVLNVPQDVYDLRDRMYLPTLQPLKPALDHRGRVPRVYNQFDEGACTGFALAAVVNLLLASQGRRFVASPRFLYENAKRYDEWKGEEYEGSSIRGAMKGFQKHGVCNWDTLAYKVRERFARLPEKAVLAALDRPLGAYFRVTTSSINDMQSAIAEAGALLVSANVHAGWDEPAKASRGLARIEWKPGVAPDGGHAFALVGYDDEGFIVQNSWGEGWGSAGYARLSYEDWLHNRMDAWVAQMGVGRVDLTRPAGSARAAGSAAAASVNEAEIHGHYLAIDNGDFDTHGNIHSLPEDTRDIARRVKEFADKRGGNKPVKVMLWAHGGLVGEDGAAKAVGDMLPRWKEKGVYPIHFIWHTGLLEEVGDILFGKSPKIAPAPGVAPVQGWLKDKLQNAKDGVLEVAARPVGKPIWSEMKTDARDACRGRANNGSGPAFQLLDEIQATGLDVEYHLIGHSAGSIFHCELFDWFVKRNVKVKTCSFLAPAVTTDLFRSTLMANEGRLGRFFLHTMPDSDECGDHCGEIPGTSLGIYHKSLLYLVAYSFEKDSPTKLLGLARHVFKDAGGRTNDADREVRAWLEAKAKCEYRRPAVEKPGLTLHGSYDNDPETIRQLLDRVG